jgi:ferritin
MKRRNLMIGKKMQEAMNQQIKNELESAYLYLSMAAYFHSLGLDGMAQWMRAQTQEEMVHAMKFFDHIKDRDGRVELLDLAQLQKEWDSPLAAFKAAYAHEQFITSKINDLADLAAEESDHAAGILLQWFVTEQIEEEASTSKVAQMLEMVGDSGNGLLMLDRELGTRTFTMPAPAEEDTE